MSSSAISALNTDYLQIAFSSTSSVYQGSSIGSSLGNYGNSLSGISSTNSQGSDSGQLSPFAQLVSTLQQVQEQNPTEYQQLATQIATNLQTAAQTAQASGNSSEYNQLGQLATDFTNAASTGQLPNLQDLAQAVGGSQSQTGNATSLQSLSFNESITFASSSSLSSNSSNSTTGATAANSTTGTSTAADSTTGSSAVGPLTQLKQLLASFLASVNQDQSQSLNPLSIIQNALSSAGISYSNN